MGRSRIKELIKNQNTKRIDERAGNKSRKLDSKKIHENVTLLHSVAVLSHYNTFKYIWIIHNVQNTLENSHILSTHKVVLAAECTEDYETQKCNPLYYIWT